LRLGLDREIPSRRRRHQMISDTDCRTFSRRCKFKSFADDDPRHSQGLDLLSAGANPDTRDCFLGYLAFGRGLVPSGPFYASPACQDYFFGSSSLLNPASLSSLRCFSCAAFLVLDSLLSLTRLHSASRCIHYPNYTVNSTTAGGHGCGGGHIYGLMGLWLSRNETLGTP